MQCWRPIFLGGEVILKACIAHRISPPTLYRCLYGTWVIPSLQAPPGSCPCHCTIELRCTVKFSGKVHDARWAAIGLVTMMDSCCTDEVCWVTRLRPALKTRSRCVERATGLTLRDRERRMHLSSLVLTLSDVTRLLVPRGIRRVCC